MPSPTVLNFEKLLAPIAGENPAGVELRSDPSPVSDYYTIKDARNKAAAAERKISAGDADELPPDWRTVVERGTKAIAEKSRSISFAACGNTQDNMHKAENKDIPLVAQATLVKSGVVRVMELQELGWAYVKP